MSGPVPYTYPYLTQQALRNLDKHKYSCEDASVLNKYIFQKFWNGIAPHLPNNVAPNTLTVLGLACMAIPSFVMMYYIPSMKGDVPAFVYLLNAVGVFLYQTLDALDGKQARRLGAGSPLGEICDHGCDAISTWLGVMAVAGTLQLGLDGLWFLIAMSTFTFWSAHFHTYNTGRMVFGEIDVTEGQIIMIACHLTCYFKGSMFWTGTLDVPSIGEVPYIAIVLAISVVGSLVANFRNVYNSAKMLRTPTDDVGHAITPFNVFAPILPMIVLHVCAAYLLVAPSTRSAIQQFPLLLVNLCGNLNGIICMELIFCHMCSTTFAPSIAYLLPVLAPAANAYFGFMSDEVMLWSANVVATIGFFHYVINVTLQLCEWGHIKAFTVTKWSPPAPGKTH